MHVLGNSSFIEVLHIYKFLPLAYWRWFSLSLIIIVLNRKRNVAQKIQFSILLTFIQ